VNLPTTPPPATSEPTPPPPAKPLKPVQIASRTVYLERRSIHVPAPLRGIGANDAEDSAGRAPLGSQRFECDLSTYRAVATVKLGRRVYRLVRRRLAQWPAIRLRANFTTASQRLSYPLKLKKLRRLGGSSPSARASSSCERSR
jgi:hypothetical protein